MDIHRFFMGKTIGFLVVTALIGGFFILNNYIYQEKQGEAPIGGERDEHGCLGPAGYSFDEEVGACTRAWEFTPDIREAARMAVEHAGEGYALTVVSFNSYEEQGAYDIMLERGLERTPETVYIRDGVVVSPPSEE